MFKNPFSNNQPALVTVLLDTIKKAIFDFISILLIEEKLFIETDGSTEERIDPNLVDWLWHQNLYSICGHSAAEDTEKQDGQSSGGFCRNKRPAATLPPLSLQPKSLLAFSGDYSLGQLAALGTTSVSW